MDRCHYFANGGGQHIRVAKNRVAAELSVAVEAALFGLEARHGDISVRNGMLVIWPGCAADSLQGKPKKQPSSSGRTAAEGGPESSGDEAVPWIRCIKVGLDAFPRLNPSWPRPALAGLVARLADHPCETVASYAAEALIQLATRDSEDPDCISSSFCVLEAAAAAAITICTRRPERFPLAISRLRVLLEKVSSKVLDPLAKPVLLARVKAIRVSTKTEWAGLVEAAALMAACSAEASARLDCVRIARLCRSLRSDSMLLRCDDACWGAVPASFANILESALNDVINEQSASLQRTSIMPCANWARKSIDEVASEEEAEEDAIGEGASLRPVSWTEVVYEAARRAVAARPNLIRLVWGSCSIRASQLLTAVEAMRAAGAAVSITESRSVRTEWRLVLNLVVAAGPPCSAEEICESSEADGCPKEDAQERLEATRRLVSGAVTHLRGNDAFTAVVASALGRSLRRTAAFVLVLDELRPLDAARAGTFGRRRTARELLRRRAQVLAALAAHGPGPSLPAQLRCAAIFFSICSQCHVCSSGARFPFTARRFLGCHFVFLH